MYLIAVTPAANDAATVNAQCASARVTASASWLSITANQNRYFVIVSLPLSTTFQPGAYGLRWNYLPPSPTATSSSTRSATSSLTASITASASATASFSTGASQSSTTSNTASVSATASITGSSSATPSLGFTATPTQTAQCNVPAIAARLSGLNNTATVFIDTSAPLLNIGNTACTGIAINAQPKQVILVDFGASFVPGGSVRVTTCFTGAFER